MQLTNLRPNPSLSAAQAHADPSLAHALRQLFGWALFLFLCFIPERASSQIYVVNAGNSSVSKFNLNGSVINASFIAGLPFGFPDIGILGNNLYISGPASNSVGLYDAVTGSAINTSFITGLSSPTDLAISGGNVFVSNGFSFNLGKYDAATGSTVNASFLSGRPYGAIALSGNLLFVAVTLPDTTGTVVKADAITGTIISSSFTAPTSSTSSALAVFGNSLFVVDPGSGPGSGTVNKYDATTGALLTPSFIGGLSNPSGIALLGSDLYVVNNSAGTIGQYNAITGAVQNASLISGLNNGAIAIVVVPEPVTFALLAAGALVFTGRSSRRRSSQFRG